MTSPYDAGPADERLHQPGLFAAFRTRPRAVAPVAVTPVAVAPVTGAPVAVVPAGQTVVVEQPDPRLQEKVARDAYERGRRDERARRHGAPLLAFLVLVIALAGGTMIYLAAREGSFARGGEVVDQTIGQAATPAKSVVDGAGNALEGAGQSLKRTAGSDSATPSNAS